ncbi:LysR substrate-binding domain-containing protein, partial [Comamonas aquatica]|uniref:LysR substrate-binding domain-containing protein n=1 Tax=Comamonas aquatica TaxID=225991 RepID=UPI003CFF11FC
MQHLHTGQCREVCTGQMDGSPVPRRSVRELIRSGRIDIGFGRIRSNDAAVTRIVLREERLVLALPPSSPLAAEACQLSLKAVHGQKLIVYPKEPRPSFA